MFGVNGMIFLFQNATDAQECRDAELTSLWLCSVFHLEVELFPLFAVPCVPLLSISASSLRVSRINSRTGE